MAAEAVKASLELLKRGVRVTRPPPITPKSANQEMLGAVMALQHCRSARRQEWRRKGKSREESLRGCRWKSSSLLQNEGMPMSRIWESGIVSIRTIDAMRKRLSLRLISKLLMARDFNGAGMSRKRPQR